MRLIQKTFKNREDEWLDISVGTDNEVYITIDDHHFLIESQEALETIYNTIKEFLVEEGIDRFYPSNWAGTNTDMKYFSTKGAAEEYINITFTLDEVTKIVNNWSMCRIDEGDILRFYEKIKK